MRAKIKTTTTTIRMPEDEYKDVKELAEFEGVTVSKYMRHVIIERVNDTKDYEEGMKVLEQNNEQIPREEVLREVLGD
ncbi:type II toxin-antitoxin system RelB family antitoxin [Pediococcus argentinicus]|uniref:type II toxin-antitoxin system RelB family antitoxin n=1 Tax=Pediococcus argentinicus TaxID=480391 RepID=UPI00338F34B1